MATAIDLRSVCNALAGIGTKWFKVGVQLGISYNKLEEFKKEDDPLAALVNYCLRGNLAEPLTWELISRALMSDYVDETGLAQQIKKTYCRDTGPAAEVSSEFEKANLNGEEFGEIITAFTKLDDQPICLDASKDVKPLQSYHVNCQEGLVSTVEHDQSCPSSNPITPLPVGGVEDLKPALKIDQCLDNVQEQPKSTATTFASSPEPSKEEKSSLVLKPKSSVNIEETVRQFLDAHPEAAYVSRETFLPAYYEHNFQQLLDYDIIIYPLMVDHGLAENEEDVAGIESAFNHPDNKHIALIDLVSRAKAGEYGFMLLYICICATCKFSPNHSKIERILTRAARQKNILPPFERPIRQVSKSKNSDPSLEVSSIEEPSSPLSLERNPSLLNCATDVISDRHLAEFAAKITHWEVLAQYYLNLEEPDVVEIKENYKNNYSLQRIKCLQRWKQIYGYRATYQCLKQAALACGQELLASFMNQLPEIGKALLELEETPIVKDNIERLAFRQCSHDSSITCRTSLSSGSSLKDASNDNGRFIKVDNDISRLDDTFNFLDIALFDHLEKQGTEVDELKKHVEYLPSKLEEELHFPKMKINDELDCVSSLKSLFNLLRKHAWNFIDYHLLKHLISRFGSDRLKEHMKEYASEMFKFESETTVFDLLECWRPKRQKTPKCYDELNIQIDEDPRTCTIIDLHRLRTNFCKEVWPPLSECARFVMSFSKLGKGCIEVAWTYPSVLTPKLEMFFSSPKALTFLKENKLQFCEIRILKEGHFPKSLMFSQKDSPKPSDSGLCSPSLSSSISDRLTKFKADPASKSSGSSGVITPNAEIDARVEDFSTPCNSAEVSLRLNSLQAKDSPKPSIKTDSGYGTSCSSSLSSSVSDILTKLKDTTLDTSIKVKFGNRQHKTTDDGCFPSIALNNSGIVVEVKHQTATNFMFYRVGRVVNDEIQWGKPSSRKAEKKRFFCSGVYPQVALNDGNTVVEIHKGELLDRCCYRVGRVDLPRMKIVWGPSKVLNLGLFPDVAISNSSTVVTVFRENIFTKFLYYRVFQLHKSEIVWVAKRKLKIPDVLAEFASVDINDHGVIVLSYQVPITNHIHYRVGRLSMPSGVIDWSSIAHKCTGYTPSICINNKDQVVLIHQSLAKRHLVSNVGVARWEDNFKGIEWSSQKEGLNYHYSKGVYPSVAIDDSGRVIEVHEPRASLSRNRLHYRLGIVSVVSLEYIHD